MTQSLSHARMAFAGAVFTVAILLASFGMIRETAAVTADCSAGDQGELVQNLLVSSESDAGVATVSLEEGLTYSLKVRGVFSYNRSGATSDGRQLLVEGIRPLSGSFAADAYCVQLRGAGSPVHLKIQDVYYTDNGGSLGVSIFHKD